MITDSTFRVHIKKKKINVMAFDMYSHDYEGNYKNADDLPDEIQKRLAVLLVLDKSDTMSYISNVGRRISDDVFWVSIGESDE